MRISEMTVVMAIACMMMVYADVQPQKDFNLQRFSGRWYRVGLAYDAPSFVPYRDKLRAYMGVITPLANGNVNLTMWAPSGTGCYSKVYQYERTNISGRFTYFSTSHNKVKDVTVVETNYNEYAMVLKHKKFDREFTQVALYGRSHRVRPEIVQRFKNFTISRGFPKESILLPPPAENCPAGSVR